MTVPYSLRRELGIMFGFLAACILTVGIYYIFWQAIQKKASARDEARRKDLRARGFHHERGGYHDKALHRYASRDPIAKTQGQTLEFLTEPPQFAAQFTSKDVMMMSEIKSGGGGSNDDAADDEQGSSRYNKHYAGVGMMDDDDDDETIRIISPWSESRKDLRIDSTVRQHGQGQGQGHGHGHSHSPSHGQIGSAVSNETPSTLYNEMGHGQRATDLF